MVRGRPAGVPQGMPSSTPPTPSQPPDDAEAIIDQEAAEIDARDPDAPARIAELEEEASELGLPTPDPSEVDVDDPANS